MSEKTPQPVVNNKELIPLAHYMEEYRKADPAVMAERTGSGWDPLRRVISLSFLGHAYEITWPDFDILKADGEENRNEENGDVERGDWSPLLSTNQARILVARFLLEGIRLENPGKFLTYREVPWGEVYNRQFTGRCITRLAFSYGNRLDEYRKKMEKLGAVPVKESDAGYEIEIFPEYKIRFLIWAGDDEFPPS
ncbi:MAG: DUF3786 domain-containing protein, partial [Lachnospiraceae bacterium]|nr:DUF3786 domain-containing protein [Lachnospiraceae bacterium]